MASTQRSSWPVFRPAIRLLNQLSFPQKFGLISFCFAVPLVLVLYFLNNRLQEQISMARLEIDGVDYLIPLKALHAQIPQAMSLANAYVQKQNFATEHYPTRQSEMDDIMTSLAQVDARLGDRLKARQKFRVLSSAWEDLKTQLPKLTPDVSDAQFEKLLASVEDLMAHVGDQSTLILDPDLDSYYLMDAILLKLPESSSIMSRTRKLVGARTQGSGMSETSFNQLASEASLLRSNLDKIERGMQVAFDNNKPGTLQAAMSQPVSQYADSAAALLRLVESTSTPQGRAGFSADQYQNIAATALMSNNRLWDRAAEQLKVVLDQRAQGLRHRLITLLSIAFAAIVVVTYLWIAFYRGIINTVRSLQDATERMKAGDEDILVQLEAKDELGHVGEAFNEVAHRLIKAGRNYRGIFEGSLDGIFRTAPDGRYLEANAALAQIYKYESVDLFLKGTVQAGNIYVDPERRGQFQAEIEHTDKVTNFESEVRCADGSTIWISETARLVRDESGKPQFYEGIVRDITERKRAEVALQQAMTAAESANQSKSEFLANMSHEIRTPMNAILGFTELLIGLVKEPRQKSYLTAINSSGRTLLALINDILDLSKIEAGKLSLEYDAVDVGLVMRDVQHIFSQKAEQKGLDIQIEVDPSVPQALLLDEIRLRQILFNLVGNAIKFTERGHVRITAAARPEPIEGEGVELVLEVEDTGVGIPISEQQRIFEAFSQQSGQSHKQYGGTGLGLTITRRLVEMMQGHVRVTSKIGKGSTFRLSFPQIKTVIRAASAPDVHARVAHELTDLEPTRIMVADDITMNRDLIRAFLDGTPHTLFEATNGAEALTLARQELPDVILMDVRMPVMDGVQATRAIKGDAQLRHIPVIVITASAMQTEEAELKPICDGYLRKPVSRTDLAAELRHFRKTRTDLPAPAPKPERPAASRNAAPLTAATRAKLHPVLSGLRPEWERLCRGPVVGEVRTFCGKLKAIAKEHEAEVVTKFAEELLTHAESFDLVSMETKLQEFAGLLETVGPEAA